MDINLKRKSKKIDFENNERLLKKKEKYTNLKRIKSKKSLIWRNSKKSTTRESKKILNSRKSKQTLISRQEIRKWTLSSRENRKKNQ